MKRLSVNIILNKLSREISSQHINETDVIEWIGEALEFMKIPQIQEQAVSFIEVKDYECYLPKGFHMVLQVAKANTNILKDWVVGDLFSTTRVQNEEDIVYNEDGDVDVDVLLTPSWSMTYYNWITTDIWQRAFTPVRLSNNVFFNSVVCKEKFDIPYASCSDEYTVAGDRLRFSFPDGIVALAYLKNITDTQTGYPMIPDDISYITAITYYVKWKIAEGFQWERRDGYDVYTRELETHWLKYCKQAKNKLKMPQSLDDFQDMLEESHQMIPRQNRYYGYFGHLGKMEVLPFKR